ncbi:MAG TPA: CheR family methyltransferase, partial [Candidatus Ozemobacteraceae bacterium]|nr:CheR family methyltransferase [Candidatus Ozemobacteraceae bacterium]
DLLIREIAATNAPVEVVAMAPSAPEALAPLKPAATKQLNETLSLTLSVQEFPFLRSHVMDGKVVLPMAVIAEWLAHGALHDNPGFRFNIVATDISSRVLQKAGSAVYSESQIEPVPLAFRHRFLLKSRDASKKLVRIHPALRKLVEFKRVNLMVPGTEMKAKFHVIFCRNVIIYFNRQTQERVLEELCNHLHPSGFLFLGHSEAITGLSLPLTPVAPAVYRKMGED